MCDPVLGDHHQYYVPVALVDIFKAKLIPRWVHNIILSVPPLWWWLAVQFLSYTRPLRSQTLSLLTRLYIHCVEISIHDTVWYSCIPSSCRAYMITPNQFEAELLTGTTYHTYICTNCIRDVHIDNMQNCVPHKVWQSLKYPIMCDWHTLVGHLQWPVFMHSYLLRWFNVVL